MRYGLVSDQVPYMLLAGKRLKSSFPSLKHVTCLIQAISLTCEVVKRENQLVNTFIAGMEAALSKSHKRRQLLSEVTKLPFFYEVVEIRL